MYLTNASEVALSLLQMDVAEEYLDRATRYLNPDSVADPWIYKLYLTLNQGRFDDARNALDRMMVWREQQEPLVSVMNRAEHYLVSASFLMIAGYAEDASKLSLTALNQPDRNGSYSADDAQKDAYAALLNMAASRTELQIQLEQRATMDWLESVQHRRLTMSLGLAAWRAERRAAALFAEFDVLQNRLRPYAPLDVHIPEWLEPEIVGLIGSGVMSEILETARANGAFQLNEGYYFSYATEIAAVDGRDEDVIEMGNAALGLLPAAEVLLRARIAARMAVAFYDRGEFDAALTHYQLAMQQDPSIIRRLDLSMPVTTANDGSALAESALDMLLGSPRFDYASDTSNGLLLEVRSSPEVSACLRNPDGEALSCYTLSATDSEAGDLLAQDLVNGFHNNAFGLGFEISKAQRSILLGSNVYLSSQSDANPQRNIRDNFLAR